MQAFERKKALSPEGSGAKGLTAQAAAAARRAMGSAKARRSAGSALFAQELMMRQNDISYDPLSPSAPQSLSPSAPQPLTPHIDKKVASYLGTDTGVNAAELTPEGQALSPSALGGLAFQPTGLTPVRRWWLSSPGKESPTAGVDHEIDYIRHLAAQEVEDLGFVARKLVNSSAPSANREAELAMALERSKSEISMLKAKGDIGRSSVIKTLSEYREQAESQKESLQTLRDGVQRGETSKEKLEALVSEAFDKSLELARGMESLLNTASTDPSALPPLSLSSRQSQPLSTTSEASNASGSAPQPQGIVSLALDQARFRVQSLQERLSVKSRQGVEASAKGLKALEAQLAVERRLAESLEAALAVVEGEAKASAPQPLSPSAPQAVSPVSAESQGGSTTSGLSGLSSGDEDVKAIGRLKNLDDTIQMLVGKVQKNSISLTKGREMQGALQRDKKALAQRVERLEKELAEQYEASERNRKLSDKATIFTARLRAEVNKLKSDNDRLVKDLQRMEDKYEVSRIQVTREREKAERENNALRELLRDAMAQNANPEAKIAKEGQAPEPEDSQDFSGILRSAISSAQMGVVVYDAEVQTGQGDLLAWSQILKVVEDLAVLLSDASEQLDAGPSTESDQLQEKIHKSLEDANRVINEGGSLETNGRARTGLTPVASPSTPTSSPLIPFFGFESAEAAGGGGGLAAEMLLSRGTDILPQIAEISEIADSPLNLAEAQLNLEAGFLNHKASQPLSPSDPQPLSPSAPELLNHAALSPPGPPGRVASSPQGIATSELVVSLYRELQKNKAEMAEMSKKLRYHMSGGTAGAEDQASESEPAQELQGSNGLAAQPPHFESTTAQPEGSDSGASTPPGEPEDEAVAQSSEVEELRVLRERVTALEAQLAECEAEMDSQISSLSAELEEERTRSEVLRLQAAKEQRQEHADQVELRVQLKSAEGLRDQYLSELKEVERAKGQLTAKLEEAERSRDQGHEVLRTEAERLRAEAEGLRTKADEEDRLRAEAEDLRADAEALRVKAASVEHLQNETDVLKAKIEALSAAAADADSLRAESDRLRSVAEGLKAEAEGLRTEVSTLKGLMEEMKSAGEKVKGELEESRARGLGLEQELREGSERLRSAEEFVRAREGEAEQLRLKASEAEQLRIIAEDLRAEAERLRDEAVAEKLKAEAEQLKAEAQVELKEAEGLKAHAVAEGEAEGLREKLAAAEMEVESLKQKAGELKIETEAVAEDLRFEVDELRARLQASEEGAEALKAEGEGLRNEVEGLKVELAEAEGLRADTEGMKTETEGLKVKVAEAEGLKVEAQQLRAEAETLRSEVERLRPQAEEVELLRADTETLRAEADAAEGLKAEGERLSSEAAQLMTEAEGLKAEIERLRAKAIHSETLRTEAERLSEEAVEVLSSTAAELGTEIQGLRIKAEEAEALRAEAERLRAEADELRLQLQGAQELSAEAENLRSETEELRAEAEDAEALKLEVEGLKGQVAELKEESRAEKQEGEKMKTQVSALEQELDVEKEGAERLRGRVAELEAGVSAEEQGAEQLRDQRNELEKELKDEREGATQLQGRLAELEEELRAEKQKTEELKSSTLGAEEVKARVDGLRAELSADTEGLRMKIESLSGELETAQAEAEVLRGEWLRAKGQRSEELKQLTGESSELKSKLSAESMRAAGLEAEADKLRAELIDERQKAEGLTAEISGASDLKGRLSQLEAELRTESQEAEELRGQVEALKAALAAQSQGVEDGAGELERLKTEAEELRVRGVEKAQDLERYKAAFPGQLKKISREVSEVESELSALHSRLATQIQQLSDAATTKETEKPKAQSEEFDTLKARAAQAEALGARVEELKGKSEEAEELKAQCEDLKTKVEETEHLRAECQRAEDKAKEAHAKADELQSECQEANAKVKELSAECQEAQEMIAILKQQISSAPQPPSPAETDGQSFERGLAEVSDGALQGASDRADDPKGWAEKIDELSSELEQSQEAMASLQKVLTSKQAELEEALAALESRDNDLEELASALQALKTQETKLSKQLEEKEKELSDAETEHRKDLQAAENAIEAAKLAAEQELRKSGAGAALDELERQSKRVSTAMARVSAQVFSARNQEDIFASVCPLLRKLMNAELCALFLALQGGRGQVLRSLVSGKALEEYAASLVQTLLPPDDPEGVDRELSGLSTHSDEVPREEISHSIDLHLGTKGLLMAATRSTHPVVTEVTVEDERYDKEVDSAFFHKFAGGDDKELGPMACLAVCWPTGQIMGVLQVCRSNGQPAFSEHDMDILKFAASTVGLRLSVFAQEYHAFTAQNEKEAESLRSQVKSAEELATQLKSLKATITDFSDHAAPGSQPLHSTAPTAQPSASAQQPAPKQQIAGHHPQPPAPSNHPPAQDSARPPAHQAPLQPSSTQNVPKPAEAIHATPTKVTSLAAQQAPVNPGSSLPASPKPPALDNSLPTINEDNLPEMDERFKVAKLSHVMFDYEAVENDELNVKAGDSVLLLGIAQPGWFVGMTAKGQGAEGPSIGLVPGNYLKIPEKG